MFKGFITTFNCSPYHSVNIEGGEKFLFVSYHEPARSRSLSQPHIMEKQQTHTEVTEMMRL